jgi:hypothetical protein
VSILSCRIPRKEKPEWCDMPLNHKVPPETEASAVLSEAALLGGAIWEGGPGASHSTAEEANARNATGSQEGKEANAAETLARAIDGLAAAAQAISRISATFYNPPVSVVPLSVAGIGQQVETETLQRGGKKTLSVESTVAKPPPDAFASVAGVLAHAIDALVHASEALVGTALNVEPAAVTAFAEGVKTVKVEAQRGAQEAAALATQARRQIQAAAARADAQSQAREVAMIEAEARAAEARYRAQEVAALRAEARCQADEVGALAAETLTSIQDVENFIKTLIASSQAENLTEDSGE